MNPEATSPDDSRMSQFAGAVTEWIAALRPAAADGQQELADALEGPDPDLQLPDEPLPTRRLSGQPLENPYLAARRTWNDHVARIVVARTMWQAVAIASLLVALSAVAGFMHLAQRPQFVPYVVEVDDAGNVRTAGAARPTADASGAVIEAQLEKFITLSRRVTTDISLQTAAIHGVFSMLTPADPATRKMREHLDGSVERVPFNRAKVETVTTEITSVLQQTEDTWQLDWVETVYSRQGERKARVSMRALVDVYQADSQRATQEALRQNPLSVYIRDFTWNPLLKREVHQ